MQTMYPDKPETYVPLVKFVVKKYFRWAYKDTATYEDLVSEGVVRILKVMGENKWNPELSSETSYYSTCVRRLLSNYIRKQFQWNKLNPTLPSMHLASQEQVPRRAFTRDDTPQVTEAQLEKIAGCLTPMQLTVFKYLREEKTPDEIAKLMRVRKGAVYIHISRIRVRLIDNHGDIRFD